MRESLLVLGRFFMLFFLLLSACGSANTIKKSDISPFKIIQTATAKGVEVSGNMSVPVMPSSIFKSTDTEVVSYVKFLNLTGTHQIRWEWYTPDGSLMQTSGNFPVKARAGTYITEGTTCHKLNLQKNGAADHPGDWKVKIYMDDALAVVDEFSLQKVNRKMDYSTIDFGNYHALVIGNNDYRSLPKLQCANNDAREVAAILEENYGFKVDLKLDATREDIVTTLDDLRRKLIAKDNLLIYYAGHGWLDRDADEGYWLPVDAVEDSSLNWISNSQITASLKAIQAKHVLVVADSCYAGKLTRDMKRGIGVAKDKSHYAAVTASRVRSVLCSGGLEPVADSNGANDHSIFAAAFIKVLMNNNSIMDGLEVFTQLRRPVMLNSDQNPEYSDIRKAGHDSGDFLFVRRK